MNENEKAMAANPETTETPAEAAAPQAAARPAGRRRKPSAQAQREAAAREIEAVSHAPVAMQVAHAPHGTAEDSNSAPLPAAYPYKNRIKRADYDARKPSCK